MNLDKAKKKLITYFTEASKVLNIDYKSIDFEYECIGKRFKTNDVTCETSDNKLFINLDWLNMLPENEDYDLQYQMYHEARHFYQHYAIKDYHTRGKTSELPSTIKKWETESSNYIPNEGTEDKRKAYAVQDVEIDANAFAIAMLSKKGYDEAKIPKDQVEKTMNKAIEIRSTLEKLGRW